MARILYIHATAVPPAQDERKIFFYHISDRHEGAVVQPVWGRRRTEKYCTQVGRFDYYFTFSTHLFQPLRVLWQLAFYVSTGLYLHYVYKRRFDIVMTYGWNTTGLAGLILKWCSGAKLILEIPGTPAMGYRYATSSPTIGLRIKSRLSTWLLQLLLKHCDGVKLLYPSQLHGYLNDRCIPIFIFHSLVPITLMEPVDADEKYILLAGFPWYLKGVDLLIRAFKQVADEYPTHRLRIVGHCPDRSYFDTLRAGDSRIEFHSAVPNEELLSQIARCSVFVVASRTEGMARVLLEAMGLCKPIVASRVGGIPDYVRDGENGLLFDSGSEDQLANALRRLLRDPELRCRLARRGYQLVHSRYSEKCFADHFDALVSAVLRGNRSEVCEQKNSHKPRIGCVSADD